MSTLTSSPGLALRYFSAPPIVFCPWHRILHRGCLIGWMEISRGFRAFTFAEGLGAGGHGRICDS